MEVRRERERRQRGSSKRDLLVRQEHRESQQQCCGRHGAECGEQPPHAPRIEGRNPDPSTAHLLADQQAGDQVAGDHEEDVDARESASRPGHADVTAHETIRTATARNPSMSGR
jgi:hypothetical protein